MIDAAITQEVNNHQVKSRFAGNLSQHVYGNHIICDRGLLAPFFGSMTLRLNIDLHVGIMIYVEVDSYPRAIVAAQGLSDRTKDDHIKMLKPTVGSVAPSYQKHFITESRRCRKLVPKRLYLAYRILSRGLYVVI